MKFHICVFLSLFLHLETFGVIMNIGGRVTLVVPVGWSSTITADDSTQLTSPSGELSIFVLGINQAQTDLIAGSTTYDGLNTFLEITLYATMGQFISGYLSSEYIWGIDSGPTITKGRHPSGKYYSAEIDFTLEAAKDNRTIIGIGYDGETSFIFIINYNISYITTEDADGYNAIVSSVDTPVITDPDGDADGDGIINFDEFILHGTDPYSPDTHGDGVTDSFAISRGLLPKINYSEIVSTARTAGQNDVTSDPATYSLYTSSDVTSAEATARALEKDDIINNPIIHGLFGENTVEDVRIGAPMMRKNSEGKLLFDFQIQASDDLKNWTTLDTPEYEVIPSSDKEFLRVRVSNEQFK